MYDVFIAIFIIKRINLIDKIKLQIVLEQHMKTNHQIDKNIEISTDILNFECKYCTLKFATENALTCHVKSAHQLHPCMDNTIVPPPSMKICMQQDEIVSLYYCHLCGAEYRLKYNLKVEKTAKLLKYY